MTLEFVISGQIFKFPRSVSSMFYRRDTFLVTLDKVEGDMQKLDIRVETKSCY